jgi:hypothetical protein
MLVRKALGHSNGGEKLGAVSAQVALLVEGVREQRAEMRVWRGEVQQEFMALRLEIAGRIDKHEIIDDTHHAESLQRIERLDRENLDGAKIIIKRVEDLEKAKVAVDAVDKYKTWLVSGVVLGGAAAAFNALRLIDQVSWIKRAFLP